MLVLFSGRGLPGLTSVPSPTATSYVSIFGLSEDAKLVDKQYSWLGSILYLAQLVMQPLAAFLLVKLPTGKLIAGAIFLWGSAQAIMSACTNFPSLLALRFLLGAFEAMIAPSCVAVTQMWWRRSEQTLRTSYWNAMNGITAIIGSLFTFGLGHIESEVLFKYQIIFLFCGLLTVAYSVIALIFMPDSPMEAKYLGDREKVIAVERLRANQMGVASREWRWDHAWETLLDIKTWCWFVAIVAISYVIPHPTRSPHVLTCLRISSGGISTFGSLIIRDFGFINFEAILFNIPFGAIQFFVIIGSAWAATRFQRKGLTIAAISILPIVGTIIMLTVPRTSQNRGVLLFGYYLVRRHLEPNSISIRSIPWEQALADWMLPRRCLAWRPSRRSSTRGRRRTRAATPRRSARRRSCSSACARATSSARCSTTRARRRSTARGSSPT